MTRVLSRLALSLLAALVCANGSALGASIYSSNFDMRFGYVGNAADSYTTGETAGANTPDPSPGLFSFNYDFAPRYLGGYQGGFSGFGPTFPGGVLADGSITGFTGWSPSFQFTVDTAYLGSIPGNIVPGSVQVRLHVNSVSIYASAHPSYLGTDLNFSETTVLNPGASPSQLLQSNGSAAYALEASFDQLLWNPSEFLQTGLTSSRTFVLDTINPPDINAGPGGGRAIDGFQIIGFAEVTFLVVPEPGTWALYSLGALGLAWCAKRKQRTQK